MLNPSTIGTLNTDKIRIWHLNKNGDFEMFYKEFLRAPYDYSILEGTDIDDNYKDYQFYLGNQVNEDFLINKKITSKILWNETDSDIVVVEIRTTPNSKLVYKIWVNGVLKLDVDNNLKPVLIKLEK